MNECNQGNIKMKKHTMLSLNESSDDSGIGKVITTDNNTFFQDALNGKIEDF